MNDNLLKTGDKTENRHINVKKLHFVHIANGDRSKTARIIRRNSSGDEITNVNFLRRHLQPLLRSAPGISYRIR